MKRTWSHRSAALSKRETPLFLCGPNRKRACWVWCGLGVIALVVGACREPNQVAPTAKVSQRLILATQSEPDSLDPLFAESAVSSSIRLLGQRELTVYNPAWELVPDLATEVPSEANGRVRWVPHVDRPAAPQMLEVTWTLRPDARWEDGVPVTGDDFLLAWEIQRDPTQEIVQRAVAERIERMEVRGTDRRTLVVTWREPYAFFADHQVHRALPAHRLASVYRRADGTTASMKRNPYGQAPLANGPFRFAEWQPGQYLRFVRNDQYVPRAELDEIVVRIIPNQTSMQSALLAGDIDGVLATGGFSAARAMELTEQHPERFVAHWAPGLVWAHIDFNLDDPILQDRRVRRALAMAIDRQGLIDALFGGKYEVAQSFLPPRHWGYAADLPKIPYDLPAAARLLDEAGYLVPEQGTLRQNRQGQALRLTISAVAGISDIERLEQAIQSDFRKIGVELRVDNRPAKIFFGDWARKRKFPHLSFYSWVMSPSSWGDTLWQADMIPSEANGWQGKNYPGWRDEEVTALLRRLPFELSLEQRKAMMRRVQERFIEDLPAVPMYFRPVVAVARKGVEGWAPTGTLTPLTWNAGTWRLSAVSSR